MASATDGGAPEGPAAGGAGAAEQPPAASLEAAEAGGGGGAAEPRPANPFALEAAEATAVAAAADPPPRAEGAGAGPPEEAVAVAAAGAAARHRESSAVAAVAAPFYEPELVTVRAGDEEVEVDMRACAPQAALFESLRAQARGGADGAVVLTLPGEFPGGPPILRNIVKFLELTAAEERAARAAAGAVPGLPPGLLTVNPSAFRLEYDVDNICSYLEGAAALRCPLLLRDSVLAPAAREISSRRVLALLERVIQFTSEADPDGPDTGAPGLGTTLETFDERGRHRVRPDAGAAGDLEEDYVAPPVVGDEEEDGDGEHGASRAQVVQAFCQVIQRLCARLDAVDFRLTASLARGPVWASLEVLRAFQVKVENLGRMNYALQSVSSTVKSFFYDEANTSSQQQKQDWKEHHFALHVFRKQIIESTLFSKDPTVRKAAEAAMMEEQEPIITFSDDEKEGGKTPQHFVDNAEEDLPEAIIDGVSDGVLAGLAGFVLYCDPLQTPPALAAGMVRSLLLVKQVDRARNLFTDVFVRSRKTQAMVTTGDIPVDFLSSVKRHRVASFVLRRLLARYESLNCVDLCHLLHHVLLEEFRDEKHCMDLVLKNELIQDIVVFCRVSTRAAAASREAEGEGDGNAVVSGTSGIVEWLRLRRVGEQLFAATFVIHNGLLPLTEDQEPREGSGWRAAECPWDSGDLDLDLLRHVPETEDALHLSRRVLLRGLVRRQLAGVEDDVPTLVRLWALGRWPQCRDAGLVSEAFGFVSLCWRALRSAKASARWPVAGEQGAAWLADEENLFQMFSDLEFWRLQPRELLTPWLPPQLLACHLAARCRLLDEQQRTLFDDNRSNLKEVNRLRHTVSQLFARLEVVDARSLQSVQKQAEVVDYLRTQR